MTVKPESTKQPEPEDTGSMIAWIGARIGWLLLVGLLVGGAWGLIAYDQATESGNGNSGPTTSVAVAPTSTEPEGGTTIPDIITTTTAPTTTTTPPTTTTTTPPTTTTTLPTQEDVTIVGICQGAGETVWQINNPETSGMVYTLASPVGANPEGPYTANPGSSQILTSGETIEVVYNETSYQGTAVEKACENLTSVQDTTVRVLNGTGRWNLAKRWADATNQLGYTTTISNWPDFGIETTRIEYRPGYREHAENLRSRLYGFVAELTETANPGDGTQDVAVVLGTDAPDTP